MSLIFGVWIIFLDSNDLVTQYNRQQKTKQLKKEKKYYEQQIKLIEKGYQELLDNPKRLEKLAREKYLLKKDKEDVYLIIEEKKATATQ